MATSQSTNPVTRPQRPHPTTRLTAEERAAYLAVAQEANYEVQQLADLLRTTIENSNVRRDEDGALRGICMRLSELSDIVYESFLADDEFTDLSELQRRLGVEERHV